MQNHLTENSTAEFISPCLSMWSWASSLTLKEKNEFLQFSSEAKQEMNFLIWHGLQKRWLKHEMNIFSECSNGTRRGEGKGGIRTCAWYFSQNIWWELLVLNCDLFFSYKNWKYQLNNNQSAKCSKPNQTKNSSTQ